MNIGLMIPTLNAGLQFNKVLDCINLSEKKADLKIRKIIIDSYSSDDTVKMAFEHGFDIYKIKKSEFTHGEVRRRATNYLSNCNYIIFMTQDVYLNVDSILELVSFIKLNSNMAIAYGKQEAEEKSNFFDKKDREFNYPNKSLIKCKDDIPKLGIKTAFSSDAFSIYDVSFLKNVVNFPQNINFAEDMYMAARAIQANYKVGYCAKSVVTHSNNLNYREQFVRYKNIGKFHSQNKWIVNEFGKSEKSGISLVVNQSKELAKSGNYYMILKLFIRSFIKYVGYRYGELK